MRTLIGMGLIGQAVFSASACRAATVNFPDFSNVSALTLVGSTAQASTADGEVLRLVPALGSQLGGAILKKRIKLAQNGAFVATFQFRITNAGGDGFAFILADHSRHVGVANGGEYLGYHHVGHSVAVTFDTYQDAGDPGNNTVTVARDGAVVKRRPGSYGFPYGNQECSTVGEVGCLSNGDLWTVQISYDGALVNVSVQDGPQQPFNVVINYPVDLVSTVTSPDVVLAFSASTGAASENIDILNLKLVSP